MSNINHFIDLLIPTFRSCRFAVAVENDSIICIVFDKTFYRQICAEFLSTTVYRSGYQILDHFLETEDSMDDWSGFPNWLSGIDAKDLCDMFNVSIDGGGIKPEPFSFGEKIHPMLLTVLRNLGYSFKFTDLKIKDQTFSVQYID